MSSEAPEVGNDPLHRPEDPRTPIKEITYRGMLYRLASSVEREIAERDAEIARLKVEVDLYRDRSDRLTGSLAAAKAKLSAERQRARLADALVKRIFDHCEQYGVLKESLWAEHADDLLRDILAAVESEQNQE